MPQCKNCGLLGVRRKESREICEVELGMRNGEKGPVKTTGRDVNSGLYDVVPICVLLKHPIHTETSRFQEVIETERECDGFTSWIQGFSPREHKEMIDRQWMMKHQQEREDALRAWQEKMAERDHQWRIEQAATAAKDQRERDETARRWRKEDRTTTLTNLVVSVIASFVTVAVTLVGASKLPWFPLFDQPMQQPVVAPVSNTK